MADVATRPTHAPGRLVTAARHRAAVAGYRGGWAVVRVLPDPVAYAVFDRVADAAWLLRGRGVRRLAANLARVAPDGDDPAALRALTRTAMRSYLRYWCDAFRLPTWSRERLLATCRATGDAPVREALAQGRGAVMALAHQGNWDHAGAWSTLALAPVTTVAERLEPAEVFDAFLRFREDLGMRILPLGDPGTFRTLLRVLRDGAFVPLLADRDLSGSGVEVELCGHAARMASGPAALALSSGAALFPVTIRYERLPRVAAARWGTVVEFWPEVGAPSSGTSAEKVARMTQECADHLGRGIAAHPQDWHMLQRVFARDLDVP